MILNASLSPQALGVIVGHAGFLEQSGTCWTALIDRIRRNDGVIGGDGCTDDEPPLFEDHQIA